MKLVKVNTYLNNTLLCVSCNKLFPACDLYADLEGREYVDYYCETCKPKEKENGS